MCHNSPRVYSKGQFEIDVIPRAADDSTRTVSRRFLSRLGNVLSWDNGDAVLVMEIPVQPAGVPGFSVIMLIERWHYFTYVTVGMRSSMYYTDNVKYLFCMQRLFKNVQELRCVCLA